MARYNSFIGQLSALVLWMCLCGTFAASMNFAADTFVPSTKAIGYLELSPINSNTQAFTIEVQLFPRTTTECAMSMGTPATDSFFAIQIFNGGVYVTVGYPNLPGYALASSGLETPVISAGSWQTISVTVQNINNTNAQVSAYVNGARVIDNAITRQFPVGLRQNVFVGQCLNSTNLALGKQGPTTLNGRVDNFRVWNSIRTLAEIQATITMVDNDVNMTSVINNQNLIAFYPFTEGKGLTSRDLALNSNSVASMSSVFWIVKDLADFNRTCSAIDSHMSIQLGSNSPTVFDPPQLMGGYLQSTCGPNFAVSVTRFPNDLTKANDSCSMIQCAPTIIWTISLKVFDDFFFLSNSDVRLAPFPYEGNNLTQITVGSFVRPSGVRYTYNSNFNLTMEVPTVGYLQIIPTYPKNLFGIRANNMNIYHTQFCETKAVTGLCKVSPSYDMLPENFSLSQMSFCGDQLISGSEQCDGTAQCSDNCTCALGTVSNKGLCTDVCGNSIVTGTEQCDRTYGCTSQCKCMSGTKAVNGKCIDVCGNGIVTGPEQCDGGSNCDKCKCISGYRPISPLSTSCELIPVEFVPRVNPSLDCLDVLDNNIARLYFSYNNLDGFDQSIPYGKYNLFTPDSFGLTRPTVFVAGQSLAYPLSPYITNITTTSITSLSWLVGSFNLTVDLSDLSKLLCPKAPSLEIELSTSANLTSADVDKIIENIADKYDIDPSRINVTVIVNSTTQPPTYVLIITINSPTNATEKDATTIIRDLFNDLKQNEDETKQSLTKGLEDIEPVIKQISTRPTGVEVRGQSTSTNPVDLTPEVSGASGSYLDGSVDKVLVLTFFSALILFRM